MSSETAQSSTEKSTELGLPVADAIESFLTAHQLAEKLQVSADWIYDQASSGGMPSYRIGTIRRFRISEIEDWLRRHREPHSLGRVHALPTS